MDLNALKTVLLVRDLGSIAAAARALGVDPSSVSRILAGLEQELGLRLFQRSTRTLAITEEGGLYLDQVAPLIEELEAARQGAVEARSQPRGTLRLTGSVAFVQECILPLLPRFQAAHPDLTVEIYPSDANLDLVLEGLDVAIRLAPAPKGDLISTKLMRTRYRVVASPDYLERAGAVAHPEELANRNCLRFALPHYRSAWLFRSGNQEPFSVKIYGKTVIAGALALREPARLGLGPALLADWLIEQDLKSGALVDLFPDFCCAASDFDTAAWILYPSRTYLPQKVRVMIDFLKKELGRSNA